MDRLTNLFGQLDELEPTSLRVEIERRMQDGSARSSSLAPLPGRGARLAAAVVAIVVFAGAAAWAWAVWQRVGPEPASPDVWSWAAEGWTELPPPPQWRDGAAIVWTGSELVYWGGVPRAVEDAVAVADGFSFDPETRRWSSIPVAPAAGSAAIAVWTGSEIVIVNRGGPDGAWAGAFDPRRETWRSLPTPMHVPSVGGASAWTGSELIWVGGGRADDDENRAGAALDPEAGTWRTLAEAPLGMNLSDAVWTGTEVVVVGSELDRRNRATARTALAQAYDPAADTWRELPPPPISSQTATVAFVDDRVIAWEGYSPHAAEYLPQEDRWRSLDTGDLQGGECYAQGATIDAGIVTWQCGRPTAWFAETDSWAALTSPDPSVDPSLSFSSGAMVAVGPVAVVEQIETIRSGGGVYVGSPDAPTHLWAWRPPASAPSPSRVLTAQDAENLVGEFLADWAPGSDAYLPALATREALELAREGFGGVPVLEGWRYRTWNSYRAYRVEPGDVYDVRIELRRDNEVVAEIVVTVGRGVTADGRRGEQVVIFVRPLVPVPGEGPDGTRLVLLGRESASFGPAEVSAGDLIQCLDSVVVVPEHGGRISDDAWLSVSVAPDGQVHASCTGP